MSKELPYFKFEPSAWDNGNIQICSREAKGLFIDICSMYWARLGELPHALALQKHCKSNANILEELIEHDIIIIENGNIVIQFLDEQLKEFIELSEKRTLAAQKRWDANAMQKQCKSNAIRGEKKREDKKREEKKRFTPPAIDEVINYFTENGYSEEAAQKAFAYYDVADWHDGQGNQVKNWKQKMQAVWFKPENKRKQTREERKAEILKQLDDE